MPVNDFKNDLKAVYYPTGSLDFLDPPAERTTNDITPSTVKLDILIAGAGLGGLSAAIALALRGHRVRVFEQAPELGEVGAGIQIPSNSSRLLVSWGLERYLSEAIEPRSIYFRRWQSGDVIGHTRLIPDFRREFGAPYYVAHRAHLHSALHKRALELNVEVKTDSKVDSVDERGTLTLANGCTYHGDLIIAADGIKSIARDKVLGGQQKPPQKTGFAAYRATLDVEEIRCDADTSWLLDSPNLNLWVGDKRHVMSYSISAGKSFNMVLSHPDDSDPDTWNQQSALDDMRIHFKGWDPRLENLIKKIRTTLKWPLLSGSVLDRWVHPKGKLVILGDAAHAMLPYMSQGAAIAVEDGAALAEAIHFIEGAGELPAALRVWEAVRIERSSQMQQASQVNGTLWHFADGPEQKARDEAMRPEVEGRQFIRSPNQWSDPTTQRWCFGYDAEAEVRRAWSLAQLNLHSKASQSCNGYLDG